MAGPIPKAPNHLHRYWRVATVLAALLVAVLYLPKPHHPSPVDAPSTRNAYRSGFPNPVANSGTGTTRAGIACGPGVRQVPFSHYADLCVPAWRGSNGGATAHGVTGSTITLTYREASSSELQILYSFVPPQVVGTNDEAVSTMQAYVNVFNRYFELYGRHVVLKPFTGKSNFVLEDAGLDAPQAQADAATAFDDGAFADISLVDSSSMYVTDLAADKIVAFSLYVEPASWYRSHAPYEYTTGPDCDKEASAAAAILAKAAAGQRATDVGPGLRGRKGTIGIVYPSSGEFPACAQAIVHDLTRFHVTPARVVAYSFDLATLQSQAQTIMASLSAAGVTDLVCSSCDPITPQLLVKAAVAESYFPRWYVEPAFALAGSDDESFVRLLPPSATSHVIQAGTPPRAPADQEAYTTWRLARATGSLAPTYPFVYAQLLMFFDALQNAGPDLTAKSFESGVFAMPASSPGGDFGQWQSGRGVYDPQAGFSILHFLPGARSPQDGRLGTFGICNDGAAYRYDSPNLTELPNGRPLACPSSGRTTAGAAP